MKHYEHTTRKTADLIPYINNSRTHSDKQITQIASSIKEFNFTNPILLDENNGIIAGHGRLLAAEKLKIDEVPCVVLSGLTEAQKKAYVIADNQLALMSGWDMDILKLEVESLEEMDFDLDLLGFDNEFYDDLFKDVETVKIQKVDDRIGDNEVGVIIVECAVKDAIDLLNDLQVILQKYNAKARIGDSEQV